MYSKYQVYSILPLKYRAIFSYSNCHTKQKGSTFPYDNLKTEFCSVNNVKRNMEDRNKKYDYKLNIYLITMLRLQFLKAIYNCLRKLRILAMELFDCDQYELIGGIIFQESIVIRLNLNITKAVTY